MRPRRPVFDVAYRPTTFEAGRHAIVLAKVPGSERWSVTVDGSTSESTFETEVDAWEAGVRVADRLDRDPAR